MRPTFAPGDVLKVAPVGMEQVRVGDVVVFRAPGSGRLVVHRVIGIAGGGLVVRGDANRRADATPVTGSELVGKVTAVNRRGMWVPVAGGFGGRLRHLAGRVGRVRLVSAARRLGLGAAYRRAAQWSWPKLWMAAAFRPSRVVFRRPGGGEVERLLWRGRIVGERAPGESGWRIRPPYRLLVDQSKLK